MITSIIVLTYNQLNFTKQCIDSVRKYTNPNSYELIVVDNCSTDGTVEWLKQQKDIKTILNNENKGFPKGCNQGIEIANGDNILLLNNDTIVTKNWLDNLITCLNSSEDIGAVGPVTNSIAYYSTIPVEYQSIDEMHDFAKNYNITDVSKWEERLKLIGFCMLIKKDAVQQIGLLDERFTPGNFEDDDYSVRLRQAGYRLILCKDTFIHHFGSVSWKENINTYSTILSENENKFKEKWGIDSTAYQIEMELINLIKAPKDKEFKVLHIGCGSGGTLLKIKNVFPNAQLYGIESDLFSIHEASRFSKVVDSLNGEEIAGVTFNYILLSSNKHKIDLPLLMLIKNRLSDQGELFVKIQNLGNYALVKEILFGNNPLTGNEISFSQLEQLMNESGFKFTISGVNLYLSNEQQQFIDQVCSIAGDSIRSNLESNCFIVSARLMGERVISLIKDIISEQEIEDILLHELNNYSTEKVIDIIIRNYEQSLTILNKIAIENFVVGIHDNVLPYLKAAFELESNDTDTLYNLGFVLNEYNEKELANQYLSLIQNPDQEVQELLADINSSKYTKVQQLTFLLRRLEFDIDIDETKRELGLIMVNEQFEESLILEVIATSIIDKIKVLQIVAIICFEIGLHDYVIPYLKSAYDLDQTNNDTLYNLGYFLLHYEENELAERFLSQIDQPDEEILDLLKVARGDINNE